MLFLAYFCTFAAMMTKLKQGCRWLVLWLSDPRTAAMAATTFLSLLWFILDWNTDTTFRSMSDWMLYVCNLLLTMILLTPWMLTRRVWVQLLTIAVADGFCMANLMYNRTYLTAIPADSYAMVSNLADFTSSVTDSLRWKDGVFLIILAVGGVFAYRSRVKEVAGAISRWLSVTAILALITAIGLLSRGGFYQAYDKNSGDNKPAGTGIGLSLSKEYVLMHHGKIWAENCKKGKGVFFIVELPTGREHFNNADVEVYLDDDTAGMTPQQTEQYATTQQTEEAQSDKDERSTILLVEDNIDMCRMLQIQLGEQFNVYTAHEGNEGLKKTYQYHPDIIITDLMMPGMNGMELLHSIRQDFSISHIPVIILTAKNTDEDKLAAIKEGANAYIAKPFSKSYLLARIEQLLEEQHIFQRKMVVQNVLESGTVNSEDEYEQHLVKKDIKFVHDIHTIIENNLNTNDFNIDTIADTIGLSRSAFFKKLKSLTGFAPVDLVREIRLNKAAKLIENSDESISEIAYSVGFRDAGYFGKCFRKKYGMTPKEYRRSKTDIVQNTNDASL